MPELIPAPAMVPVPGGKIIEEYVGHASSGDDHVSVAQMLAPAGWEEPAQEPEFDEFTIVLESSCIDKPCASASETCSAGACVTAELSCQNETCSVPNEGQDAVVHVRAGQAVITRAGERIRYTTTHGARYIAVCMPAFHGDLVHRDDDDEYDRHPVE